MFAGQLVFLLLVSTSVFGTPTKFSCPENCRCDDATSTIQSCAISSLLEYSRISTKEPIKELSVADCNEGDFAALQTDSEGYKPVLQLNCKKLTLLDNTQYPNCRYSANSIPPEQCLHVCREINIGINPAHSGRRKCFCCDRPVVRVRRSPVKAQPDSPKENLAENTTDKNNTETSRKALTTNIVAVGGLSVLALLINFVVMVKLCCSQLTVIDLFATALFFFNIILSLYGLSMAFYVFRPELEKYTWYCQFFTSIKLFSLGSALYTMVFLIFHRPIRRSSGEPGDLEEGKKKAAHRDAIFKGIVFLLEAVMLAGVLGVLSWIKTSNWRKMCVIITPMGSVEGLLHGIEVWYIVLSGLLVSWYFGNLIYRQYKRLKEYREKLKQKEEEDDDMGNSICDEPDTPEIAPYIIRDFPIFVLVALSFSIWLSGFVISNPDSNYLSFENAPVARVCSLLVPIILQPLIYIIRETWVFKCFCFRSGKHRTNTVEEIKLNKSPSDESQGDSQEASNNNLELTQFDNITASQPPIAKVEQTDQSDDDEATENDLLHKKSKTRANDFQIPKVVCRSPVPSGEETRLLDDTDSVRPEPPKIVVGGLDVVPANTDQINGEGDADMNGRVSRGPTFYPIAEKEGVGGGVKPQVELKSYSPIKEEERIGEQVNNNGKEKRKDKSKKVNSTDSTGSLESDACSRSDSSSSHEDTLPDKGDRDKPDWDPNKFEGKPSPTELTKLKNEINKPTNNNNNNNNINNNNNSDIDQIIPNNTNPNEATGPKSEANHTGKRLKKPVLTRDNSGSVER